MTKISNVNLHQSGRQVRERGAANIDETKNFSLQDLQSLGIGFAAMDSALIGPAATTGFIPAHMLQTWMSGTIRAITTPVDIDYVAGVTAVGNWHDDEIAIRTEEDFGMAELYGDNTNIPLASNNPGVEIRDVVRFEQGFILGELEMRRLDASGFASETSKRRAAARSLDMARNIIGWNGLANTRTYGLLNDPNIPALVALGAGTAWLSGTFATLSAQLTAMRSALDAQMGIALRDDAQFLLLLPTGYRGIFNLYNTAGNLSLGQWLKECYPNLRIEYSAALKAAVAGEDVAYLIAENVSSLDDSDVDAATIIQAVPSRFEVIGSEKRAKGYIESASNALAGIFVLRPWAVTRAEIS